MPTTVTSNKNTFRAGSDFGIPPEAVFPVFTASGGKGGYTWSDFGAGGRFVLLNSTQAEYRPANKTQVVTIKATGVSSGGDGLKTLDVSGTFPLNGQWGTEGGLDIETLEQKARGGTRYFREEENAEFSQQIDCLGRRVSTEGAALKQFWRDHKKTVPFYFLDTDSGELQKVRFVSALRWRKAGDIRDYFVNVRGYDEETILDFEIPEILLILPAANSTVSGTITLSASATDNVAVQDVQFKVDGLNVGALLTVPPYQISFNTATVANGKRIITARARDTSGNIAEAPARIVTVNN